MIKKQKGRAKDPTDSQSQKWYPSIKIHDDETLQGILDGKVTQLMRAVDYKFDGKPQGTRKLKLRNPSIVSSGTIENVGDICYIAEKSYKKGSWKLNSRDVLVSDYMFVEYDFFPEENSEVRFFNNPPAEYKTHPLEKLPVKDAYGWYERVPYFLWGSEARIWLETVSNRRVRLQDVSSEDMILQGRHTKEDFRRYYDDYIQDANCHDILHLINWEQNPDMWLFDFKVIKNPRT